MINLLITTHDFIKKNNKFANKKGKGVKSQKKKYFRCFEVSTYPPGQVRACLISDFWSNFTRFGFKIRFLTKFHNDSASFLPEELKKHIILIKTLIFDEKSQK